jgi:3-hydroxyisobutyrate dehydrogenase
MKQKIGFIGVGTMGKPMALNLLKAGYGLVACDVDPVPLKELKQKGAVIARSGKEVAGKTKVIITMLPRSEHVEEVILGENGVLEGAKPKSIVIDMSTIDPGVSKRIAQVLASKDIKMLDAPVSGGQMGAVAGTLSIMVGGSEEVYKECLDIFNTMGKTIVYCGPNGNGEITKVVNNLLGGIQVLGVAEALALGVKAGMDFKVLLDVLNASTSQCHFMKFYGPMKAFKGDFEPGFMAELMQKDLGLAVTLAKDQGVPLLVGGLSHQVYTQIKASGLGKKDFSVAIKVLEDLLNIKLRI